MSLFQWLGLCVLAVLAELMLAAGQRGQVRKRIVAFWLTVWIGGGVVVAWPEATGIAADKLGIGRGADLLLYSSVLVMFSGFFYVYTRFRRLDQQITMLVRRLATENAAPADQADLARRANAR